MYRQCIGDEHGSNPRRESSGATLFALENEFPMPFGRAEIHGPAGYTQPIFRQNELFAVVPLHSSSLLLLLFSLSFLRLMRACYAVGYVGREEQLAEG